MCVAFFKVQLLASCVVRELSCLIKSSNSMRTLPDVATDKCVVVVAFDELFLKVEFDFQVVSSLLHLLDIFLEVSRVIAPT